MRLTAAAALALALLVPAVVGKAQIQTMPYRSQLRNVYVAITPNLLLSDTGTGTGGITLRGGAGCDGIAAWDASTSVSEKGTGGLPNMGY